MPSRAASRHATQALSSKNRERMKPDSLISVRGSRFTKSPTEIPKNRVSSALLVRSSRRTSRVSAFRAFVPASLLTWEAPFSSTIEPRIRRPLEATMVTPSLSVVGQLIPFRAFSLRRPLGLISFTIKPSVSTWAVNARGAVERRPSRCAIRAPFLVRSVGIPRPISSDSMNPMPYSVSPVGDGVFRRSTRNR